MADFNQKDPPGVLAFSRNRDDVENEIRALESLGCRVEFCGTESQLWQSLSVASWDVFLQELDHAAISSDLPAKIKAAHPELAMWAVADAKTAANGVPKRGFHKIFEKPVSMENLFEALQAREGTRRRSGAEAQILVVAPDPLLCERICDFLFMDGHRSRAVRSGADALAEIKCDNYQVVLVDSEVSDILIWDLARQLQEASKDLIVVALADAATLNVFLHSPRADVYDYLLKPLDAVTFHRSLRRVLEKQRMGSQIHSLLDRLKKTNADLLHLNDLKSKFLRIVSHDLRTPLTALKGYAQALRSGLISPEKYPKCFDTMVRESEHLEHLIGDLVDFVSMEAGKFRIEMRVMSVFEAFEGVLERYQIITKGRNIEFSVEGLSEGFPEIEADPGRMDQLLTNLIGNAVKHTPDGGRIGVHFERQKSGLKVSVSDTGEGISSEHLSRVFDPLFQAANSPAKKYGLGLGLAIAREISRAHGGSIGVHSAGEGKGATFWFTIPWVKAHAIPGAKRGGTR